MLIHSFIKFQDKIIRQYYVSKKFSFPPQGNNYQINISLM